MKVIVLGGGDSTEREVSLRSAKAVSEAARSIGHEVVEHDPAAGLGVLDGLEPGAIVLPILHGRGGEDGAIQVELERRKLAYLGSDSQSSARCFDKSTTRDDLERANILIPRGALVSREDYKSNPMTLRPHVLKVARGGSSIGTLIVRNPGMVRPELVDEVFNLDSRAIIEELIVGTELTVPIHDQTALTPIEIRPPRGSEFDYENKYNGATAEICPPETVNEKYQLEAKQLSEKVHQAMRCRHLSRVDLMLDTQGRLYILEINTIPGLTDQSLYPRSAAVAGMDMPGLVGSFIGMVKRDFGL